jgi:endonuclease YncB( thermonuclease family)
MQWPVIFVLWLCLSTVARAGEKSGTADVRGATLWVCGRAECTEIRLCGIAAPRVGASGYRASMWALKSFAHGKSVRCAPVGSGTPCDGYSQRNNHDRLVAQCFTEDGDVAEFMIRNGYACDWWKFSGGYYSRTARARVCDGRSH